MTRVNGEPSLDTAVIEMCERVIRAQRGHARLADAHEWAEAEYGPGSTEAITAGLAVTAQSAAAKALCDMVAPMPAVTPAALQAKADVMLARWVCRIRNMCI